MLQEEIFESIHLLLIRTQNLATSFALVKKYSPAETIYDISGIFHITLKAIDNWQTVSFTKGDFFSQE